MKRIILGMLLAIGCLSAGVVEDRGTHKEEVKACKVEKQVIACATIAIAYEENKQMEKMAEYFELSCNLDLGIACTKIANIANEKGDVVKADTYFLKGCEKGDSIGCFYSGKKLLTISPEKGASLLNKACDLDYSQACDLLGVQYFEGKNLEYDMEKAFNFFEKGCKLNNEDSCTLAALINKSRVNFLKKDCDKGFVSSCIHIGRINFMTDPLTEIEITIGLEYLDKACALKDQESCEFVSNLRKEMEEI